MRTVDVIILGNGILGLSLARALSLEDPALRLAVVGPSDRAGSASLAAGAMINVWAELEADALEDPALAAKWSIAKSALALWDGHVQSLAAEADVPLAVTWGTWVLDNGRGGDVEQRAFDYLLKTLAAQGEAAAVTAPSDLPFLAPDPRLRPLRAVRVPDGHVDSRAVLDALTVSLGRRRNVTLLPGRAAELNVDAGRDKIVRLEDGRALCAATAVLANGAFAQRLIDGIPALRQSVPRLMFGGGFALDVDVPDGVRMSPALAELSQVVRTLDRGAGCGIHLIPRGGRSFYCGASSHVWLAPEPRPRLHVIHSLGEALHREVNHTFFHATVAVRGPGYRPVTADAYPLLGESAVAGVWFCNGTKRDGFTGSPFIAKALARAIAGRPAELPQIFRPSRPLISYRSRSRAMDAAAQARVTSELLNGVSLPGYRWEDWLGQVYAEVRAIYDRRGVGEFGIHPELLHLYDAEEGYRAIARHHDPT